jgi:hypothetical protein
MYGRITPSIGRRFSTCLQHPAPDDYLRQVMVELNKLDLEHIPPMQCSGQNFIVLAKQEIPEKLVPARLEAASPSRRRAELAARRRHRGARLGTDAGRRCNQFTFLTSVM